MSAELKTNGGHRFSLTRYYGGEERGACIQVTGENCDRATGYIGIPRAEALALAKDLLDFACEQEVEEDT